MSELDSIFRKVNLGQRLSDDDALTLFYSPDLLAIGRMADFVNRRRNGKNVYFNVNRHINPTNICALSCKFCAFSRKPGEEGAYAYSIEEIITKADAAVGQGATEVHMVGGLHPRWNFRHYLDIISAVKTKHPGLHIKAFTAVELDWMARRDRRSISEILKDLVAAGLGSIPGGGAEIFHPEVRDQICDTKVSAEQWINTHRLAHNMGLRSNCTMLYGHIERFEHRVDHMRRLRELQDETHGFSAFIPLSFQPDDNGIGKSRYTYGYDDLKTMAVARLYLDNFANIKAYWVMLGQDIAQLALNFGANDIDGTVTEEKISRMAGGSSGMVMSRSEIETLIQGADGHPVERDTLYRPIGTLKSIGAASFNDRPLFTSFETIEQTTPREDNGQRRGGYTTSIRLSDWENAADPEFAVTYVRAEQNRHQTLKSTNEIAHEHDPVTLVWDLSGGSFSEARLSLECLVSTIQSVARVYPSLSQTIIGVDALTAWAMHIDLPLETVIPQLKSAGIATIEHDSSDILPMATELDLDVLARVLNFHALCHRSGIFTSGRILIQQQDTEDKVKDLVGCFAAGEEKEPGYLSIHLAAEADVTPVQFLAAVGWVRSAMGSIKELVTPFFEVASLRNRTFIGTFDRNPLLKVAPLGLHFGATDLGPLYVGRAAPELLQKEIRAFGCLPQQRNGRFLRISSEQGILKRYPTNEAEAFFHAPVIAFSTATGVESV